MTGAHLHLLVNHVPIIGAFFALGLFVASFRFAAAVLQRTALVVLVGVALFAAAAKYTGEPAEDAVRGMPGVTRAAIHEHEEMADNAFFGATALGILALVVLWRARNAPIPRGLMLASLAGTVALAGVMAYVGLLGGEVRHTEVRRGATAADGLIVEPPRVRPQ